MIRALIPAAPYAAIPGGETLFVHPPTTYRSIPPALLGLQPADPEVTRGFLEVVSRTEAACPAETVMLYRDAFVLGGCHILSGEGLGVRESYYNVDVTPALVEQQRRQLAAIAAGDVTTLPSSGPPLVALFLQDCNNFGHLLTEMLPRLLHLEALGLREMRLLLPDAARPFLPAIAFTIEALGLRADYIPCHADAVMRAESLHWVSLVGEGWFKSPTVLRLFTRLNAASRADAPSAPTRLFVTRPATGHRAVTNAAEAADIAERAGFTVVEPSRLPFPDQIALFAGARTLAGPMGAAFTLAAAMPPGGRMGVLSPGYCDYFYWDLACLAGHDFTWAFTAPLGPFTADLLARDIALAPRLLRRLLAALDA